MVVINFRKIVTLSICLYLLGCSRPHQYKFHQGEIFGTYYKFQIDSEKYFTKNIDSVFSVINLAANSYQKTSEISKFNQNGIHQRPSTTFIQMLEAAKGYYAKTNQYFNPALYPLINEWGFGFKNYAEIDSSTVDSLLKLTDFNKVIMFDSEKVEALQKGAMIDLSGLGEGFALDQIGQILDKSDVRNYMIEIGGEMKCKGVNSNKEIWRIGIENPTIPIEERGTSLMKIVELDNKSISTSGSYRKFYTDSLGNKYPHIIDPKSGYPVKHNLLSVSIISGSSTDADTIATACMAMGTEKAKLFIEGNPELVGILIYDQQGELRTWQSSNFPKN